MMMRDWLGLAMWVALCVIAGAASGWLSRDGLANWYPHLRKPDLNPPNWLFGPIWTTLYVIMGLAAWMVWDSAPLVLTQTALLLFGLQIALNFFWSLVFFAWRRPGTAFIDLLLIWLAIVSTQIAFATIHPLAAVLLIPYLAWVSFAGYLNGAIWRLNRASATAK
ncbi:MAG: TspO/MBR family protein [Candidatus Binataceae bacterium]|jgi:tryptophan-rich sensory protein